MAEKRRKARQRRGAARRPNLGGAGGVDAWVSRAVAHEQAGRWEEALAAYGEALARAPGRHDVRNRVGVIHALHGRSAEAESCFRAVLADAPGDVQALGNLANLMRSTGRLDEAIALCLRCIELRPDYAPAYINLGSSLFDAGRLQEAAQVLGRAIELAPDAFEPVNTLGAILQRQKRLPEAEEVLRHALRLDPSATAAWVNLGLTLSDLGRDLNAMEAFTRALEIDPTCVDALTGLGGALMTLGRLDDAARCFEAALQIEPDEPSALHGLEELDRPAPEGTAERLQRRLERSPTAPGERMLMHFWLARHAHRAGDPDAAFRHLHEAHAARAEHLNHRPRADEEADVLEVFQEVFTPEFFQERAGWSLDDERPVFVVGMPRSGTSLVEQILASHSRVYGAGELDRLPALVREMFLRPPVQGDLRRIPAISRDVAQAVGRRYLESLGAMSGGAERVVDKLPHNFRNLWLVALLFPRASVLHVVRDPLDTCLSCYFQNFAREHPYTDDLRALGAHYVFYRRLMELWRAVLPTTVHDVHYEALVSDPDEGIGRLLAAAGLEPEDACYAFHETDRAVRTASVTQVRKKAYTSSIGRWRRYRRHLEPLIEVLHEGGVPLPAEVSPAPV